MKKFVVRKQITEIARGLRGCCKTIWYIVADENGKVFAEIEKSWNQYNLFCKDTPNRYEIFERRAAVVKELTRRLDEKYGGCGYEIAWPENWEKWIREHFNAN